MGVTSRDATGSGVTYRAVVVTQDDAADVATLAAQVESEGGAAIADTDTRNGEAGTYSYGDGASLRR